MTGTRRALERSLLNILLAAGAGANLSVFGGIVYIYLTSPTRRFSSPGSAALWLGATLGLGIFFLISLTFSRRTKLRLLIGSLGVTLVLYAVDGYFEFVRDDLPSRVAIDDELPHHKLAIVKFARRVGIGFDTRNRAEVVAALRLREPDLVISVTPIEFLQSDRSGNLKSVLEVNGREVVALGRGANQNIVWCNESGNYVTFRTDERGFRNPGGVWNRRVLDVAAVGNSFAMGGCVPVGRGFMELVWSRYPATLNLSMGGHGPLSQLAALKEFLPAFRPAIVFWIYEEDDDLLALRREMNSAVLRRYLEERDFRQGLAMMQPYIDRAMREYAERKLVRELSESEGGAKLNGSVEGQRFSRWLKLTSSREALSLNVWESEQGNEGVGSSELVSLRRILAEAKRVTSRWEGRLYFVYLPSYRRYTGNLSPSAKAREAILELVSRLELPVIDMHEVFRAEKDPLALFAFRHFPHYNEYGHELVARQLIGTLSSANGLGNRVDQRGLCDKPQGCQDSGRPGGGRVAR